MAFSACVVHSRQARKSKGSVLWIGIWLDPSASTSIAQGKIEQLIADIKTYRQFERCEFSKGKDGGVRLRVSIALARRVNTLRMGKDLLGKIFARHTGFAVIHQELKSDLEFQQLME